MTKLTLTQGGLLLLFSLALAAGQLLFKLGASQGEAARSVTGAVALLLRPAILSALVLYGGATLLWTYLLTKIPLTVAYPFAALAFVFVPLGARFLLGEPLSLRYGVGMALILAGILFTSIAPQGDPSPEMMSDAARQHGDTVAEEERERRADEESANER